MVRVPPGAASTVRALAGGRVRTPGALVLGYHDVVDDASTAPPLSVSTRRFRQQLRQVRRAGLRLVPLADVVEALATGGAVDGLVAVTFDDGLAGVHHRALPVLVELGVPATAFLVSGCLGERPGWWAGADRTMTPAEVAELAAAGVTVAGHGHTHASLTGPGPVDLPGEVHGCRAALQDLTGTAVDLFAYPYGHNDGDVRAAVEDAGYRAACGFLNGRVLPTSDPLRLPRLNMWEGQGRVRFASHLVRSAAAWGDAEPEAFLGEPAGGLVPPPPAAP